MTAQSLSHITEAPLEMPDAADNAHGERYTAAAFAVGLAINAASIIIGNPYTITAIAVAAGLLFTLMWWRHETAWMLLVSILAANPANLELTISFNLIFALWLVFLHMDYLQQLPRWIAIPNVIALCAVLCSSVNWLFFDTRMQPLNQFASMVNYVAGPFLLLPIIYFRAEGGNAIGGRQLLLYFVAPSLLTVLVVYLFGHPVTGGRAGAELQTNLITYAFGNLTFQFVRTQIGFVLASLICVSVAVILCEAGRLTRAAAVCALAASIFLLMVTGSIASTIACIGGLTILLVVGVRHFSAAKYLVFLTVAGALVVSIWSFTPKVVQDYVVRHYEDRLGSRINNADREERWVPSLQYIAKNPEGVGWSLYVEEIRIYPHNDYLAYGIAYGVVGALVYLCVPCYLLFRLVRSAKDVGDVSRLAVPLAGIGVVTVIILNSLSDHLSANRWYFNLVWSVVWLSYFSTRPGEEEEAS